MAVKIVDGSSVHKNFDGILKSFMPYAKEKLGYDKPVDIQLISDPENAKDAFGKTAYYDPSLMKITVFVDKRHVKDILRSISHELVHHKQNCQGRLHEPAGEGYAQNDPHLREMEAEAYLEGNGFLVRDYEDKLKESESMKKDALDEAIKRTVKKILSEISDLAEQEDPLAGDGMEEDGLASALEAAGLPAEQVAVVMDVLQDKGLDVSMEEGAMPMMSEPEGEDLNKDGKKGHGEVPAHLAEDEEYTYSDKEGSTIEVPKPKPKKDDESQYNLRTATSVGEKKKKKKQVAKDEGLEEDMHEEDEDVKEGPAVYMQENWVRKPLNERIYKTLIKKWCK